MAQYRILSEGDPGGLTPESFSCFGKLRALPATTRRLWILEAPEDARLSKEDLMPAEPTPEGYWRTRAGLIWRPYEESA